MTTAIIHHPVFREHDTGPNHPETPSRYNVVMDALRGDQELWGSLIEVEAKEKGEVVFRAELLSAQLKEPLVAEESTTITATPSDSSSQPPDRFRDRLPRRN